jgi:hypothetical protein
VLGYYTIPECLYPIDIVFWVILRWSRKFWIIEICFGVKWIKAVSQDSRVVWLS